ncbi:MAG: phenylalanine--tRNA ligase subunit alpha [Gemmatimonadales bacterium]|nr:phenylalanine--tRNA ligase subunit alpha [Gemmatimonadales bacterium]
MSGASADPVAALAALRAEAESSIRSAPGREALRQLKTEFLGRKAGRVTAILKTLPSLDPDTRRIVGQAANEAKTALEQLLEQAEAALASREGGAAGLDLTMPARAQWRGAIHPVTLVIDEICAIFAELGFARYVGPEAETERNNFTALNFPPDHPALDLHDTFYLGEGRLLRTHTSPLQIRVMESYQPPIRVTMPGMCYRKDPYDASHAPAFSQVEALAVDEGITFVDLKASLSYFARRFFGPQTRVRFRPSFFPFTEPSADMEVECLICHGSGCPACKNTGWMEILGSGMVDPNVFVNVGLDPERYTGWAFGMGPHRMALLRYGIPDIRMLFDADVRLHDQFVDPV